MKNVSKLFSLFIAISMFFVWANGSNASAAITCEDQAIADAEAAVLQLEETGDEDQYATDIDAAMQRYLDCSGGTGNVIIFYPYLPG